MIFSKRFKVLILFSLAISFKLYCQELNKEYIKMNPLKLTPTEAKEMLSSDKKFKPVAPKLLKYLQAREAYMHRDDGRTIAFYDKEIKLFNIEQIMELSNEKEKVFLAGPNPDSIINNIPALLDEFKNIFRVKDENLGYNEETLRHIDTIYPVLEKTGISEAEMFYPLVAYCGEYLKKAVNGVWEGHKDSTGKQLIIIKGDNSQIYDPYYCINKILTNGHKPYAFEVAIMSQLRPNKLKMAAPAAEIPLDKIKIQNDKTLKGKIKKPKK